MGSPLDNVQFKTTVLISVGRMINTTTVPKENHNTEASDSQECGQRKPVNIWRTISPPLHSEQICPFFPLVCPQEVFTERLRGFQDQAACCRDLLSTTSILSVCKWHTPVGLGLNAPVCCQAYMLRGRLAGCASETPHRHSGLCHMDSP